MKIDFPAPAKAVLAALCALLALLAGGVFWYLLLLVAGLLALLALRTQPPPPEEVTGEPLFEQSRQFLSFDPVKHSSQRKQLAQQLERKIANGNRLLSKAEMDRADESAFELDRIGLYLWRAHAGDWPTPRTAHLKREFEVLGRDAEPRSLMCLHYALELLEQQIREESVGLDTQEADLISDILAYLAARPGIDVSDKIKPRLQKLLAQNQLPGQKQAVPQPAYGETRFKQFENLVARRELPLRIESMQNFITINDNGDTVLQERHDLVAVDGGAAISIVPTQLRTDYGFVPEPPKYRDLPEGRSITWRFLEGGGMGFRSAEIVFNPPLDAVPVSFTKSWKQFNAVYFNRRDRRDAGQPDGFEGVDFLVRYRYERLHFRLKFSDRFFPTVCRVEAWRVEEQPGSKSTTIDHDESAWASAQLEIFADDRVVKLSLAHPLPSYIYKLRWELPETDGDEKPLTKWEESVADEIVQRIAALVNAFSPYRSAAISAMQTLSAKLTEAFGGEIRLRLYSYAVQNGKGGLMEVLERDGQSVSSQLVTIGRTLVGRAHRRKAAVVYQSVLSHLEHDLSFEPVPSEKDGPKPAVAVAIALLCPEPSGRRAAVLYLSTPEVGSGLLKLFDPTQASEREKLAQIVKRWYANELCSALNMRGILQTILQRASE